MLCSFAILAFAGFPALASAVVLEPYVPDVSATPTATGATLRATIYPYGSDTHYRFEYGTTTAYGTSVPVPDGDAGSAAYPTPVDLQETVSGLTAGTVYHFRLVASNAVGQAFGDVGDHQFTTTATPPTVTDEAATETGSGIELKGTVNPQGSATSYQFEYGTSTSYGSQIPVPEASVGSGSSAVAVAQTLTGLLPNTTYHFRLVARNPGNLVATGDRTFLTPAAPPSAPVAVVEAPQAIAGGYRLEGAINPDGLETSYHFELGTSTSYGTNLPAPDATIPAGSSPVAVSEDVPGLAPNTTYHYKIVATNSEGTGESGDQAFTTPPPKPTVSSLPVGESDEGFTLNGSVNPNGAPTTYRFEFGVSEAYGQSIPASEVSVGSGSSPVPVSQLVKGLPPGVPYHYRLVAHNAGGTSSGDDVFFATPEEQQSLGGPPPLSTVMQSRAPVQSRSNAISARVGVAKAGKVALSVVVPGAGTVSVSGKGIRAPRVKAARAGAIHLTLKLTSAGRRALKKAAGRKLEVRLTIVFRPLGGSPGTTHKTVVFR